MAQAIPVCLKHDEIEQKVEQFCPKCGQELDWKCGDCGYGFIDHEQDFCDDCGEKLEW